MPPHGVFVDTDDCMNSSYVGAEMKFTKARGDFRKCLKCGNEWDVPSPTESVEPALAG